MNKPLKLHPWVYDFIWVAELGHHTMADVPHIALEATALLADPGCTDDCLFLQDVWVKPDGGLLLVQRARPTKH